MARPDLSQRAAALERWRHGQRHAEAAAEQTVIASAWTWLTTPPAEQRAICTATHFQAAHARRGVTRHGTTATGDAARPCTTTARRPA